MILGIGTYVRIKDGRVGTVLEVFDAPIEKSK